MWPRRFRHRARIWLERAISAALIAAPLVIAAAWLAFQYKPHWYRPARLDPSAVERARAHAITVADQVSGRMAAGRPFHVVLRQRSVNEWIAALPRIWPEARTRWNVPLDEPAVGFSAGQVHFGGHYQNGTWQAIVSLAQSLRVTDDGRWIEVKLTGVWGGLLPVPRSLVSQSLDPLLARGHEVGREKRGLTELEPLRKVLRNLHSASQLFDGVRLRNRFVWFNGRRPFRIRSIRVEEAELHLHVEPL